MIELYGTGLVDNKIRKPTQFLKGTRRASFPNYSLYFMAFHFVNYFYWRLFWLLFGRYLVLKASIIFFVMLNVTALFNLICERSMFKRLQNCIREVIAIKNLHYYKVFGKNTQLIASVIFFYPISQLQSIVYLTFLIRINWKHFKIGPPTHLSYFYDVSCKTYPVDIYKCIS